MERELIEQKIYEGCAVNSKLADFLADLVIEIARLKEFECKNSGLNWIDKLFSEQDNDEKT